MIKIFILCVLCICNFAYSQANKNQLPIVVETVTSLDKEHLDTIRVNLKNSFDPDGQISRKEVMINGVVYSNMDEIIHLQPLVSSMFSVNKSISGKVIVQIKIWDNKNAVSVKSYYVDANKYMAVQDIASNIQLKKSYIQSSHKDQFVTAPTLVEKKYILYVKPIRRNNTAAGIISYFLDLFNIQTSLNSLSAQVELNGVKLFSNGEISKSETLYNKFVQLITTNSIVVTNSNSQAYTLDVQVSEVSFLKESNPPIVTSNLTSNTRTNQLQMLLDISDESPVFTNFEVNGVPGQTMFSRVGLILKDNSYNTIRVSAVDLLGNQTIKEFNNIWVDSTSPKVTEKIVNNGLPVYINQTPKDISFRINFSEEIVDLKINGVPATISAGTEYSNTLSISNDGQSTYNLEFRDLAGNIGTYSFSVEAILVTSAPTISDVSSLPGLTNLNDLPISFDISSEVSTDTSVSVNGAVKFTTPDKNIINRLITDLAEGLNRIVISVKDIAGNISSDFVIEVNVDTLKPNITYISLLQQQDFFTNKLPLNIPIEIQFSEAIKNFSGTGITGTFVTPNKFIGNLSVSVAGNFEINLIFEDFAGNLTEYINTVSINFSDRPPLLTFSSDISDVLTNTPSFLIEGFSNVILSQIKINGEIINLFENKLTFSSLINFVQDGLRNIRIEAIDIYGNVAVYEGQIRSLQALPDVLVNFPGPTWAYSPPSYQPDFGHVFSSDACSALQSIFSASDEFSSGLQNLENSLENASEISSQFPPGYQPKVPSFEGLKSFIGSKKERLNYVKAGYLAVCKGMHLMPDQDCNLSREMFRLLSGQYPEPMIIRSIPGLPISVQNFIIPRLNICTGFDDSGLTCNELVEFAPFLANLVLPAAGQLLGSPAGQFVAKEMACNDLCSNPLAKTTPVCAQPPLPNLVDVNPPTIISIGHVGGVPGGGFSWGGSSGSGIDFGGAGCGGWFSRCGGSGISIGGFDATEFACTVFPSLYFCSKDSDSSNYSSIDVITTFPCEFNGTWSISAMLDFANQNQIKASVALSSTMALCQPTTPVGYPDMRKPSIKIISPIENQVVVANRLEVEGYVDDLNAVVKINGVEASTYKFQNKLYFKVSIETPSNLKLIAQAVDSFGNRADDVLINLNSGGIQELAAGDTHTCALVSGKAYCWGKNHSGQLGLPVSTPFISTPQKVNFNQDFVKVATGADLTCAISVNNDLVCWGGTPRIIDAGEKYVDISLGSSHYCGITTARKLKCWGANSYGQLGMTNFQDLSSPQYVNSNDDFVSVDLGGSFTCGVTTNGSLKCWGINGYGQLGYSPTLSEYSNLPVDISQGIAFKKVYIGARFSCATSVQDVLYCWGDNQFGQLANGNTNTTFEKVQIGVFKSISVGWGHVCAINNVNNLLCWGMNVFGQIGDNTTIDILNPELVIDSGNVKFVASGIHTCAYIEGDELKCWGFNSSGQLGLGFVSEKEIAPRSVGKFW